MTWQAYGETLEEKLKDLHARVHGGSDRACLEDKIVQQAVVFVLEAIYEEDLIVYISYNNGEEDDDSISRRYPELPSNNR